MANVEQNRLEAARNKTADWKLWGPYLSERSWGTVREDYSSGGDAWHYFPHDHARSKAYRWGEDGIAGISDRSQYLCFALAVWNGQDAILKERMFGLSGPQGNHGEDAKEYWYYLDSTPTHSYMKMLYRYPHAAFPYDDLVTENARRGFDDFEYELLDTGVMDEGRYFDVTVEYAKSDMEDILIQVSVKNFGPEAATFHLLPNLWFRNTWSWGYEAGPMQDVPSKPQMSVLHGNKNAVCAEHPTLGTYYFYADNAQELLFTENETNYERLYDTTNVSPYVKDAFHRYLVNGEAEAVNPAQTGTKVAPHFKREIAGGDMVIFRLRLAASELSTPFDDFDAVMQERLAEADAFYADLQTDIADADQKDVQRQAFAGMLWTKQLFYYDVEQWLQGDPANPKPPIERWHGRNSDWRHLNNFDIISMPDKWEYPWYAGWDLAFHCIPLAYLDPDFAKEQLIVLTREWYMHPNGQLPAYEWVFGDVNPPVHAWAARRVYEIDAEGTGTPDTAFLKRVFHKLLLNFTWWVNQKDRQGRNIFQGGFLGLDNISIFDRSHALPVNGYLDQSDGTAWMGFFSLSMLNIAIELAKDDPAYDDMTIKFFEHFLSIAEAMSGVYNNGVGLWDDEDGFYYDVLRLPNGEATPLRVRSLVGLLPMIAIETIGHETLSKLPQLQSSINWLKTHRPSLTGNMMQADVTGYGDAHIVCIPTPDRLRSVLKYMLDENEFLSPYGIRSISKHHEGNPFGLHFGDEAFFVDYQPAESRDGLFGGNSNWRGPIWFPMNYLIIESLGRYYRYFGDDFKVEHPTGSGNMHTLKEVALDLSQRLVRIFTLDEHDERPVHGSGNNKIQGDTNWRDHLLFYEYFHGDNGAGLGASHQTGWTGLIAELIMHCNTK